MSYRAIEGLTERRAGLTTNHAVEGAKGLASDNALLQVNVLTTSMDVQTYMYIINDTHLFPVGYYP